MLNPRKGVIAEHDLRGLAIAKVQLIYQGAFRPPPGLKAFEVECEIYEVNGILSVHTVCPKCRNAQWIDGRNKKVEYDKERGLFIEAFTCPWELGGEDDRREFGFGLCQLRLAYDGKIIKDA